MNNYNIIIPIWFFVSVITLLLFRLIPKKMRSITDQETRNSLFTVLIFTGVPLLLAAILTPAIFIIGDKDMEGVYKIAWIGLCMPFIVYFLIVNRSKKPE